MVENVEADGVEFEVVAEFGELGPGALVTEAGLARMFGKHPASIKRAVDRGELPRPTRLMGKPTWTAGKIVEHIESRQDAAAREAERMAAKVQALRP